MIGSAIVKGARALASVPKSHAPHACTPLADIPEALHGLSLFAHEVLELRTYLPTRARVSCARNSQLELREQMIRHWLSLVYEEAAGTEGFGPEYQRKSALFYSDDGMGLYFCVFALTYMTCM